MSAPSCFEHLASAHLNVLRSGIDEEPAYCLTEPTQAQRTVLRSLRMTHLIDDQEVAAQIHPRRHP
jgi:hypothetical protein